MSFKIGDKVKYVGPVNPRLDYFSDYTISYALISGYKLFVALEDVGQDLKLESIYLKPEIKLNIDTEKIRREFIEKLKDARKNSIDEVREKFPNDKPFEFNKFKTTKPK